MAPECLLERKKAAVHSDVWSLACTLVELFTEIECWKQLLEGKEGAAARKSDDLDSNVESLIAIMSVRSKCNIFSIIRSCVTCFSFAYAN